MDEGKMTRKPKTPETRGDVIIEGMNNEVFYPSSGRRHAGNNAGVDGSAQYQANAMDPLEWSYKSYDNASIGNSTISEGDGVPLPRQIFRQRTSKSPKASNRKAPGPKLVQDMNWVEKRIAKRNAATKKTPLAATIAVPKRPLDIDAVDSLSYASNDNDGYALNSPSELYSNKDDSVMSSIVCRDCYAPPGKLNIVIHSTKDGPAVHSVKKGSSLEGHLFPGDLIISVDNVDTRSFTAEHVMKMMAAKSNQERKITVLHFEEESQI
jgi:C-terminal processing protease CtpA/Prc